MNWDFPYILLIFGALVCFLAKPELTEANQNLTIHHRFKRQSCSSFKHKCSNGECIEIYSLCDGTTDCSDGSDETREVCGATRCPALAFVCGYGACVEREAHCNGKTECADGSDEKGCNDSPPITSNCGPKDYQCTNGQCIDQYSKCDGTLDCNDGSDETKQLCKNIRCPSSSFQCAYGACMEQAVKCNSRRDCPDESDEAGCKTMFTDRPLTTRTPDVGGCLLPEHPKHGKYTSAQCNPGNSGAACRNTPGALVPSLWVLYYTCNEGYTLNSTDYDYSLCKAGDWKVPLECIKLCRPQQSLSVDISCMYAGQAVPCDKPMRPQTRAFVQCKVNYHLSYITPEYRSLLCKDDGEWDYHLYDCTPDCGISIKPGTSVPLISFGSSTKQGEFPWLAALYLKKEANGLWEQACGGTLITPHIVLTAAHCLVDPSTSPPIRLRPEDIRVGLGKYHRSYYTHEVHSVLADVREIVVPPNYLGRTANYAVDIGLLDLNTSVQVTAFVMPACVDWSNTITVQNGEIGHVSGWGTTENQTSSETVLSAKLKYIDVPSCIGLLRPAYQKQVTHDKFCAGSNSGQVDKGDSGGGLTFVNHLGLHFVFGVVSLKIQDKKLSFVTLFTNVANSEHHRWLEQHKRRLIDLRHN